jgi:Zn-dependent protease with chaperone function
VSSARRLYRLHIGLALLGVLLVLAALGVASTRIRPDLPSAGELLAACQAIVPSKPGPGLLVVALLALALAVAALAGRSLWRHLRHQRRFLRALRTAGEVRIDDATATVFEGARPQAFCAGLLQPRIYVSQAAVEALTEEELAAVVAHEAHHQAIRDPLRILSAQVFADAFFFLPGLRRLARRYHRLAELAADEAAAEARGAPTVAAALLRFGERGSEAAPVVGIAPERVEHLLGQGPRWQPPASLVAGPLVILGGVLGLVLAVPALAGGESLSLAMLLAEACMVGMAIAPVGIALGAIWVSRDWIRRRLAFW